MLHQGSGPEKLNVPYEVKHNSSIGTVELWAANDSAKGHGGQVDIKFLIEGTISIKNKEYYLKEYGYITVSASEWLGTGTRPATTNVTYYWPKSSQVTARINSTTAESLYLVHAIRTDAKEPDTLGMALTTVQGVVQSVLKYAVGGSLMSNDALVGWAMGGLTPRCRGAIDSE